MKIKRAFLLVDSKQFTQLVEISHSGNQFRLRGRKVIELLAVVLQLCPFTFQRPFGVLLLALGRILTSPGSCICFALDPQPVLFFFASFLFKCRTRKRTKVAR